MELAVAEARRIVAGADATSRFLVNGSPVALTSTEAMAVLSGPLDALSDAADPEPAIPAARQVHVFTDGVGPFAPIIDPGTETHTVSVFVPARNAGIVRFATRPRPTQAAAPEALLELLATDPVGEPVRVELTVADSEMIRIRRQLEIEPGGRFSALIDLDGFAPGAVTARIATPGDVFPLDNRADLIDAHAFGAEATRQAARYARDETGARHVLVVARSPASFDGSAAALALEADAQVDVVAVWPAVATDAPPPEESPPAADIAVFHRTAPSVPSPLPALYLDPPQATAAGGLSAGAETPLSQRRIDRVESSHPLLAGVSLLDLPVVVAARELDPRCAALASAGDRTAIAVCDPAPGGARSVAIAFDLDHSSLARRPDLAALLQNAAAWLTETAAVPGDLIADTGLQDERATRINDSSLETRPGGPAHRPRPPQPPPLVLAHPRPRRPPVRLVRGHHLLPRRHPVIEQPASASPTPYSLVARVPGIGPQAARNERRPRPSQPTTPDRSEWSAASPHFQSPTKGERRLEADPPEPDAVQPGGGVRGVGPQAARNEPRPRPSRPTTPDRSEWSAASPHFQSPTKSERRPGDRPPGPRRQPHDVPGTTLVAPRALPVAALLWSQRSDRPDRQRRRLLWMRGSLLAAVVLALADPVATWRTGELDVAVLVDVSASVEPASLNRALEAIERGLDPDRPVRLFAYADRAAGVAGAADLRRLEVADSSTASAGAAALDRGATRPDAALRQAAATLRPDRVRRVLLLSDGQRLGGVGGLIAAEYPGLRVDTATLGRTAPPVWIESVELEESDGPLRAGEPHRWLLRLGSRSLPARSSPDPARRRHRGAAQRRALAGRDLHRTGVDVRPTRDADGSKRSSAPAKASRLHRGALWRGALRVEPAHRVLLLAPPDHSPRPAATGLSDRA